MLLDVDLSQEPPSLFYRPVDKDAVFVGAIIKNLYDEKRINLSTVNGKEPTRLTYHPSYSTDAVYLYGYTFEPKGEDIFLIRQLKEQKTHDLMSYNTILRKYDYSCQDNYSRLQQKLFPLDPVYIQKYIPEYRYDEAVLFNEEIARFQQFTSINMYILVSKFN